MRIRCGAKHWSGRQTSCACVAWPIGRALLRCVSGSVAVIAWVLACACLILGAAPAFASEQTKRVLILVSNNITYSGTLSIALGTIDRLNEKAPSQLELLPEFLDLARFPLDRHASISTRYLADKYADKKPDVIITAGGQASAFVRQHHGSFLPGVPVVLCCASAQAFLEKANSTDVTGIVSPRDITQTLDLAERLQPDAKNLVVVAGSGKFDVEWLAFVRRQLQQRTRQISVEYLIGLPLQDLLHAVSTLPRDTIVVSLTYGSDNNEGRYTTSEVVKRLAAESSAPIYVPYDTNIGDGVLGGYVRPSRLLGAELADVALEILAGKSAADIPPRVTSTGRYRVDSRQLARWGLSEARLPADTEILFQPPSIWETHQGLAKFAIATILALLCIVALLVIYTLQRARRTRAERALTDSQRKMAFVADATNSGLWQMRSDDQPLWASNHCRTLFDLSAESPVTLEGLSKVIHADDRREFVRAMRSCARFGQPLHSEFRVVLSNGKIRWIAAKGGQQSVEDDGAATVANGLFIDVTAIKEMEQDAELQRSEVRHLTRQALMNELSGSIAHELNQPLAAILSNAEAVVQVLETKRLDRAKLREIIEDIISEDTRAAEVVSRVRRMLKKGDAKIEHISISALLESTIALLRAELARRKTPTELSCFGFFPLVFGDAVQLQQVFINLLMNAMDAMADTPAAERMIRINAHVVDDSIKVCIADCGQGIPDAIRNRLFEPFVTTKERGLGLGLSICASILKAHDGDIEIVNNAGPGATVTVTLRKREATSGSQTSKTMEAAE